MPSDRRDGDRRPRRSVVLDSWARCDAARPHRDVGSGPPLVSLEGDQLAAVREAPLLGSALQVCRELLADVVCDSGAVFALGDAGGTLLWVIGDPSARGRLEDIGFREGATWSEDEAGTNAPGTALIVGRPVQIIAGEHYNPAVRTWSCAAAPIREPDGADAFGVLDITGGDIAAGPHALALVRATARVVECELARRMESRDARARARAAAQLRGPGDLALVSPGGRVLEATGSLGAAGFLGHVCQDGTATLLDGRRLGVEPVGPDGHVVVRRADPDACERAPGPACLTALGRDCAVLEVDGQRWRLGPRHSEILVLLALAGEGLSATRLAVDLFEEEANPATVRVAMSRLRHLLGDGVLESQPYSLRRHVRTDVHAVRDFIAEGRVAQALEVYTGPLLPRSLAPAVCEHRVVLEQQLRGAVLASGEPRLLRRWVAAPWGVNDAMAWGALARLLPQGSPQRGAASVRAGALLRGL